MKKLLILMAFSVFGQTAIAECPNEPTDEMLDLIPKIISNDEEERKSAIQEKDEGYFIADAVFNPYLGYKRLPVWWRVEKMGAQAIISGLEAILQTVGVQRKGPLTKIDEITLDLYERGILGYDKHLENDIQNIKNERGTAWSFLPLIRNYFKAKKGYEKCDKEACKQLCNYSITLDAGIFDVTFAKKIAPTVELYENMLMDQEKMEKKQSDIQNIKKKDIEDEKPINKDEKPINKDEKPINKDLFEKVR
jgi:hypothetical protein